MHICLSVMVNLFSVCFTSEKNTSGYIEGNLTDRALKSSTNGKDYPYVVLIQKYINNKQKSSNVCGGAIISDMWVLTVARCFTGSITDIDVMTAPANKTSDIVGYRRKAIYTVIYQEYDDIHHDIGLLKVNIPFSFAGIKHISLPDASYSSKPNSFGIIVGWRTKCTKKVHHYLQTMDVLIVDENACLSKEKPKRQPKNYLCAAYLNESKYLSAMGGVLVNRGNTHLLGLAPFTNKKRGSLLAPVKYLDVSFYKEWINKQTGV